MWNTDVGTSNLHGDHACGLCSIDLGRGTQILAEYFCRHPPVTVTRSGSPTGPLERPHDSVDASDECRGRTPHGRATGRRQDPAAGLDRHGRGSPATSPQCSNRTQSGRVTGATGCRGMAMAQRKRASPSPNGGAAGSTSRRTTRAKARVGGSDLYRRSLRFFDALKRAVFDALI